MLHEKIAIWGSCVKTTMSSSKLVTRIIMTCSQKLKICLHLYSMLCSSKIIRWIAAFPSSIKTLQYGQSGKYQKHSVFFCVGTCCLFYLEFRKIFVCYWKLDVIFCSVAREKVLLSTKLSECINRRPNKKNFVWRVLDIENNLIELCRTEIDVFKWKFSSDVDPSICYSWR